MLSDIVSNEGKESDPATWEKCLERYIENLFSEGDAVALRRLYQKLDQMRAAVKQKRDNLTAECSTTLIERDLHRCIPIRTYAYVRDIFCTRCMFLIININRSNSCCCIYSLLACHKLIHAYRFCN